MNKTIYKILLLIIMAFQFTLADVTIYHKVKINLNSKGDILKVYQSGIDLEGSRIKEGVFVECIATDYELNKIDDSGLQYDILEYDMAAYYEERLAQVTTPREYHHGSMGGYLTYDEIVDEMDSLFAQYPNIVSEKISLDTTIEGRNLWAFKISDNPSIDEDEPEVFFNSLIHAREPAAMMTIMYYVWQLVENYEIDPVLTHIVNERELWFLPVINPDGYVYNETNYPNGGGMHRKNRHLTCSTNNGIDLNRNWGYQWGYDNTGSSNDPCSNTYRGESAFSERETNAVKEFVLAHDFKAVLNYHTYSDLLIRPFGYNVNVEPSEPDLSIYQEMGHDLVQDNGYNFGTGMETVGYMTNGDAVDWMYGDQGIINYTPEVGGYNDGGFWPNENLINELVEENLTMNIRLSLVAGAYLEFLNFSFDDAEYLNTDSTYIGRLTIKNKGLTSEGTSCTTVRLSSPDSSLTIETPVQELASLNAQEVIILNDDNFLFTVNAPHSEIATLIIALDNGSFIESDTLTWFVGEMSQLFTDNAEISIENWETTYWGRVSSPSIDSYSFNDSPNGYYHANSDSWMTLAEGISLSEIDSPQLQFEFRMDVETGWDFVQVMASGDNGATWTALPGNYTSLGNGASVQPVGEPGYSGVVNTWTTETMDLSDYEGVEGFKIAFRLLTDGYVEGDGFFVDNIKILGYRNYPYDLGDVTMDGVINVADVVVAIEHVVGSCILSDDAFFYADMDENSVLNILDIVQLLELVLAD